jgi:NAD(P)H-dependent FMN reductase
MPATPRILAFAGSSRKDSYNKKLVKAAAAGATNAGAEVTYVDLGELAMPIFDEDMERAHGLPPGAKKLKELMKTHNGLLISSPEYNSALSALLKNAIDWTSRPEPNETPLVAFDGKVAGLMAASPGALGGLRGLAGLRSILGNIRVLVIPDQVAVNKAHEAFDADGRIKDDKQRASVEGIGAKVAALCVKLNG